MHVQHFTFFLSLSLSFALALAIASFSPTVLLQGCVCEDSVIMTMYTNIFLVLARSPTIVSVSFSPTGGLLRGWRWGCVCEDGIVIMYM